MYLPISKFSTKLMIGARARQKEKEKSSGVTQLKSAGFSSLNKRQRVDEGPRKKGQIVDSF
jgi:hypothetical protein